MPDDLRLVLDAGHGLPGLLLGGGLAAALVVLAYRRHVRRVAGRRWAAAVLCRSGAALALLLLLLRPEIEWTQVRADPGAVLLLLDRSASMGLRDTEGGPTRLKRAALAAADAERLLNRAPGLSLRILPFAERPLPAASGPDLFVLEPAGEETDLTAALQAGRNLTPPLRRALLLTDGNDTSGLDPVAAAVNLQVPIDVMPVGEDLRAQEGFRDVVLEDIEHRDRAPVGSVAQFTALVGADGFAGRTAEVRLLHGREVVARGEILLDDRKGSQAVALNFRPESTGLLDLTVEITPQAGEHTLENNRRSFPLAVHDRLPRVAYLEGTVRPDYKFLRRALASDPGLEFMSLVRIRDDEWLRQGEIHGVRLEGIPRTAGEFDGFDVLILGDLAATALGPEVQETLAQAVAKGLSLLLLPCPATTGRDTDYGGTPLARAFPAVPARESLDVTGGAWQTLAGQSHPILRSLEKEFGTADSPAALPLAGLDRLQSLRPAATVLLEARTAQGVAPLLVVGQYGEGRVAMFLGHDAWQWRLAPGGDALYARFWGQLLRWLAGGEENAAAGPLFQVTASRLVVQVGDEIVLSAHYRPQISATGDVRIEAQITRNGEAVQTVGFSAVPGLDSAYEARLTQATPGRYDVTVRALQNGNAVAEQTLPIRIRGGRGEYERLAPDRRLLERLASETGGRLLTPDGLPEHLAQLAEADRAALQVVRVALWHDVACFWAVCLLLSGEWLLRKRAGLP